MNPDKTMPAPASKLLEFAKRWKLDGDLIRCRGCKRGINVCYFDVPLNHSSDCKFRSEDRPWRELHDMLETANPQTP